MSLIRRLSGPTGIASAVAAAALLSAPTAIADADLTNWQTDDNRLIEQQAPRPDVTNAPMTHWRPFFLPAENVDPAASTRDRRLEPRRDARSRARARDADEQVAEADG